jgi:sugar phosphate isomerase/epimerase
MTKELIYWVEIDDADAEIVDDLWTDTIHHRRLPGEGVLDIQGFLSRVLQAGYRGPFGVEIISRSHRILPLEAAARCVFDTAMEQFRRAVARTPHLDDAR